MSGLITADFAEREKESGQAETAHTDNQMKSIVLALLTSAELKDNRLTVQFMVHYFGSFNLVPKRPLP